MRRETKHRVALLKQAIERREGLNGLHRKLLEEAAPLYLGSLHRSVFKLTRGTDYPKDDLEIPAAHG
jgi:hypothetical protein